jgi:hypothetical protein
VEERFERLDLRVRSIPGENLDHADLTGMLVPNRNLVAVQLYASRVGRIADCVDIGARLP